MKTKKIFNFSRRYIFVYLFVVSIAILVVSYFVNIEGFIAGFKGNDKKGQVIQTNILNQTNIVIEGILEEVGEKIIFKCDLTENEKKFLLKKKITFEAIATDSLKQKGGNVILVVTSDSIPLEKGKIYDTGYFKFEEDHYEYIVQKEKTSPQKNIPSNILDKLKNINQTLLLVLSIIVGIVAIIVAIIVFLLGNWRKKHDEEKKRRDEENRFNVCLNKYKSRIVTENENFGLLFCESKVFSMKDAFIKLTAINRKGRNGDAKDLLELIIENKRMIITGAPGSGKSLICKKILHIVGRKEDERLKDTTPVLIELVSFKEDSQINDYLQEFNGYGNILEEQLKKGNFLFLLDGFDEKSNKKQSEKIQEEILRFIKIYPECRFIITCRDEVYNREFHGTIDNEYLIKEFEKEQIKKYIEVWLKIDNKANKNPEVIYNVLQENSNLMELAKTPLMLSMILFLHVDNDKQLPHSRGEFYGRLTKVLLSPEENDFPKKFRYKWERKELKSLLSHIAWNMDDGEISRSKIKEFIKEIKPEESDDNSIINDVLHSGLIRKIKSVEKDEESVYTFTHKTIQEYFVAYYVSHNNAEDSLLERFMDNSRYWEETIRLYCNLYGLYCNLYEGDISNFLEQINKVKPFDIALECLAEIETDISHENDILNKFISPDYKSKWIDENGKEYVLKALGLIISGYHDKGIIQKRAIKVFGYIQSLLVKDIEKNDREEIAKVLAYSQIQEATEILIEHSEEDVFFDALKGIKEVRELYLRRIAVDYNNRKAVDCLYKIGDKEAYTEGLLNLIWDDTTISRYAARLLSTEKSRKFLMEILKNIKKENVACKDVPILEDVWEPFYKSDTESTYLNYVMCRIAYLVSLNIEAPVNHTIDSWLAVPLAIDKYFPLKKKHLIFSQMDEGEKLYEILDKKKEKTHPYWKICWYNVRNKSLYDFDTSPEFLWIKIIYGFFYIGFILSLFYLNSNNSVGVISLYLFSMLLLLLIHFEIANENYSLKYDKYGLNSIVELLIVLVIFVLLIYSGIGIYKNLLKFGILLAYDVLMAFLMFFVSKARQEKQKARNPLSDLIKED